MKNKLHITIFSRIQFCIVVCCVLFFSACKKDGAGKIISKTIQTENFFTVNINGLFNVYIVPDTTCFVVFDGEERIVNRCEALVTDSAVSLTGSKKGEFLRPGEKTTDVYVHVCNLGRINANEDGSIHTIGALTGHEIGLVVASRYTDADLELNCDIFYYWNNPVGTHLKLSGTTQTLKIWNAGLGQVDASGVNCLNAEVSNGAQNDCIVRCTQTLTYSLTSTGNIRYFGSPPTLTQGIISGTGLLIKAD